MSSARRLLEIKKSFILSIHPDATLMEALKIMAQKGVGSLLVMEDDRLVGIITERDFVRKVAIKGREEKDTKVREIMTRRVITVHPEQTVNECMELMEKNNIRHLPVVLNDKVIGVISQRDVMREIIYQHKKKLVKQ
jgi:CBS domain-containing protein